MRQQLPPLPLPLVLSKMMILMILNRLLERELILPQRGLDMLVISKNKFILNISARRSVPSLLLLPLFSSHIPQMAAKIPAIPPEPFAKPRTPKTRSPQAHELLHISSSDEIDPLLDDDDTLEVDDHEDDYEAYIAKKKRIAQLPPEIPSAVQPSSQQTIKNFYSDTGPLSVAELKRIAEERLQFRQENLPSPKVDYRQMKKERKHEKANLLKAKRAALREKLYGPKKKPTIIKEIRIPSNGLTVKELAMRLSRTVKDTMEELEKLGELTIGE